MTNSTTERSRVLAGLLCAVSAYLIWGLSPIYFKALRSVAAFEIPMQWIFGLIWVALAICPADSVLARSHGRRP